MIKFWSAGSKINKHVRITRFNSNCGITTSRVKFEQKSEITVDNKIQPDIKNQMHKLSSMQSAYMEKLNKKTLEKHTREKRLKKHYRITGSLLFAFVISVYFYSMYAVSQEKFLDDFQVPTPPNK